MSPVIAAPPLKQLLKKNGEPIELKRQLASRLCWAATAEMAVNFLAAPLSQPVNQTLAATYNTLPLGALQLRQPSTIPAGDLGKLPDKLACCIANLELCNLGGDPILIGLRWTQSTVPLDASQIKRQIGTNKRPFIFSWNLGPGGNSSQPIGGYHYLIAVGYDDTGPDGLLLKVWDPWPVASAGSTPPNIADLKTIDLATYQEGGYDGGLATTYRETWKITGRAANQDAAIPPDNVGRCDIPIAMPGPTNINVRDAGPAMPLVPFAEALARSLPAAQRDRELRRAGRWLGIARPLRSMAVGTPFPVVALNVVQLLAPRANARALLEQNTHVVLHPVLQGDELVDSFLMVLERGRWQRRGYMNNEITRRLLRIRNANGQPVFLVSIPQVRAFFAAFERQGELILVATATDPSIGVKENGELPAERVLGQIAARFRPTDS